ncbi:MAG: hypothetical protein AAF717_05510 [Bacteroidota bacterium]
MLTEIDHDDDWLLDSEVQYRITKEDGQWEVSLLFMDIHDPKRFLIRYIGVYRTEKLARITGKIMTDLAARDPRGTQRVKKNAFNFCCN